MHIHRDELKTLEKDLVRLKSGEELPCDAIVCGTGWKPSLQFFDNEQLSDLGLPVPLEHEPPEIMRHWKTLCDAADEDIHSRFPLLAHPPDHPHHEPETTTCRLYQGMAPLNDKSILFMNHVNTGNKILVAEAQALWSVAHFDEHIALPSREVMERRVATWVAFSRRRYLSSGVLGNGINFESVTYADALLEEMGLAAHKKGWWRHWFEPFGPGDLGKAWGEYLGRYGVK